MATWKLTVSGMAQGGAIACTGVTTALEKMLRGWGGGGVVGGGMQVHVFLCMCVWEPSSRRVDRVGDVVRQCRQRVLAADLAAHDKAFFRERGGVSMGNRWLA